jgi:hypothetical protein
MENKLNITAATYYCNCSNQLLLSPGCQCELCMGIVADVQSDSSNVTPSASEQYDLAYFEALERMYVDFEFAA